MKKRILIILGGVLLIISVLIFSRDDIRREYANWFSLQNVQFEESLNAIITDKEVDRGIYYYYLKDENKFRFFFQDASKSFEEYNYLNRHFIIDGETRIKKNRNSNIVLFINSTDSIKVEYTPFEKIGLKNGHLLKK